MTAPIGQFVDSTIGRTSTNPFITIIANRAPTGNDGINNGLQVTQRWVDESDGNQEYILRNFISSQGYVQANWVFLGSSTGIDTLTGNSGGPVVATANNINVVGDGTTGGLFAGSGSTLTLTLNDIPNSALANDSITLAEGTGIVVTGSPVVLGGTATIASKVAVSAASSVLANAGVASFSSTDFGVDSNGFVTAINTGAISTLSDDVNTSITPTSGNIQLVGHVNEQGGGKFSTIVAGSSIANINPMSPARWIVDQLGFNGTHTTITAAIAASVATGGTGDTILILDGVYTEDFTLPLTLGINLIGLPGAQNNPNVVIRGKITFSSTVVSARSSISNVFLQTNGDFSISASSTSGTLSIYNCYIQSTNNTSLSISSGNLQLYNCIGDITVNGNTLYSVTGGSLYIVQCVFSNSGASTTLSNCSSGNASITYSYMGIGLSSSGTGALTSRESEINPKSAGINVTALTFNGTGEASVYQSILASGTASCISIGTGVIAYVSGNSVDSSNTNVFTGAGAIYTAGNVCNTSSGNNVSSINHLTVI